MKKHLYNVDNEGAHFALPHFRVREFAQSGYNTVVLEVTAMMALNNFRQRYGKRVRITSGTRNRRHNKKVGGVPNSGHLYGWAFDLDIGSGDIKYKTRLLKRAGFTRVIYYPKDGHYHVEVKHGT